MQKGDLQSRTIDLLRFPLIVYVVLIHAYTSTRGVIDNDQYPGYRLVSFFFSLEIAQIAVPAFFFISGYLLFFRTRSYVERLKKSVRSQIVPYVICNFLVMTLYYICESLLPLESLFSGANLPIRDHSFTGLLREFWDGGRWDEGNGTPILHQFWYLRNLILLGIVSPLISLFVRWTKWTGPALLLLVWLFVPGQAFLVESVTFFTAGAYFSLSRKDFLPVMRRFFVPVNILYPVFVVLNLVLRDDNYMLPFDRLGFLFGLVFTFNLSAWLLERGYVRNSVLLSGAAFFIFAAHDPMLTLVRRGSVRILSPSGDAAQIALYLLTPALIVGLCLIGYRLMKRYTPGLLYTITGRQHGGL